MSTRQNRNGQFTIYALADTVYWPGGLWFYKRCNNVTRRISRDEYLSVKDNPNAIIIGDTRVVRRKEGYYD